MTESAPSPPQPSRLGLFGMLALVGSALVGFNTLIVSCSADRVARDAAQLHRIEERERFWTDAMRDLSEGAHVDDRRPQLGELALRQIGMGPIERLGDDDAEDRIAQEFQAFVVR